MNSAVNFGQQNKNEFTNQKENRIIRRKKYIAAVKQNANFI
jgi:hypothetical protein